MALSKSKRLRKVYESKLGKDLVSKLSDAQINLLSKYYNSLSGSESSDLDSKILQGRNDTDLHEMAIGMIEETEDEPIPEGLDDLLNDIKKPEPKVKKISTSAIVKGDKLDGNKFLGKGKYQKYLDELISDGTIDGEKLTTEERKEGFKTRNTETDFQKFVDKLLERKKEAQKAEKITRDSYAYGIAASSDKTDKINPQKLLSPSADFDEEAVKPKTKKEKSKPLQEILKSVNGILALLKKQQKDDAKREKNRRKSEERQRRSKKEERLEKGIFKGLTKTIGKVLAPVKNMFSKLLDFIGTVLLGRVLFKIIEWFGDKENEKKIENIIRFFQDWWPAIAAGILLFGTRIGSIITTIGGWAIQIAKFAIPKLLRFITRNPKTAAVLAGAGYLGARILTGTEVGGDEEGSSEKEASQFQADQTAAKQTEGATPKPVQMSAGGRVPGSGNKDTVPAMLTPGEFVMSKGAVNKFGTDTLASMNAMGGGTNIPSFSGGGLLGFQGGGSVPNKDGSQSKETVKSNDESKERPNVGDWVRNLFSGGSTAKKSVDDKGGDAKGGMSRNAKALLNTIRWAEGTLKPGGYNTWFGGRTDMDLTKMTINEVVAEQKKRLASGQATYGRYTSAAVGAYQMMKPEAFAARAGLNPETDKFTPENQDKMAIAGYMMGQAGMSQAEIDAPISKAQIAKMAPVWASLPMMNGRSRYGQPVKKYQDLVNVYNKNLKGLDSNSYSTSTTIASSGSGGGGSGGGGGGSTGGSGDQSKKITLADVGGFDYMAVRQAIGNKTESISKPSRPTSRFSNISSSSSSLTKTSSPSMKTSTQQSSAAQSTKSATNITVKDPLSMSSPRKIKTLGITI